MAKTYNKMQIDVKQKMLSKVTAVTQDTQSRYLDIMLTDNGVPIDLTGEVVRIYVKKPDGMTVFEQGEITDAVSGRCQFELKNQMLAVSGTLEMQVSIWSATTEILSTPIFNLYVMPTIRNDEAVESTNEFGVLVVLFQEIQDALNTMKGIKDTFGEPGEMAAEYGADTFWKMLETLATRTDTALLMKKYLNSTIETENFKTLDDIIQNTLSVHGTAEFTTAGAHTWVCPSGVYWVTALMASGGGGGGGASSVSSSGSSANDANHVGTGAGGASGNLIAVIIPVVPKTTYNLIVGDGGDGGNGFTFPSGGPYGSGSNGNNGGNTSFSNIVTLLGGAGGNGNNHSNSKGEAGGSNNEENVMDSVGYKVETITILLGEDGGDGKAGTRGENGPAGGAAGKLKEKFLSFTGAAGGKGGDTEREINLCKGSKGAPGKIVLLY